MAIRYDTSGEKLTATTNLPSSSRGVTLCGWFRIAVDRNDWSTFLNISNVAGPPGKYIYVQTDTTGVDLKLWVDDTSNNLFTATVGTWYFVAITSSGSGVTKCYYAALGSALSVVTSSVNVGSWTPNLLSFGDSVWTGELLNGNSFNCKVWSAELTQAELEAEMLTMLPKRFTNLNRWIPQFPGSTERARDYSGNGYNMTEGGTLTDENPPPISWGGSILFLPFTAAGGTAYNQSVSGAIATVSGGLIKQYNKVAAGAIATIAGTLSRRGNKLTSGTLSTIAGTANKQTRRSLSGAVSSIAGTLANRAGKALSGAVSTITGSISKQNNKLSSGTIATITGEANKQTNRSLTGALATITGALASTRTRLVSLSGSLSSIVGVIVKRDNKLTNGSIATLTGTVNKQTNRLLGGAIATIAGNLTSAKAFLRSLSGSIGTITGGIAKRNNKPVSGAVTAITGANIKQPRRSLNGAIATLTGTLASARTRLVVLSGSIGTIAGTVTKQSRRALTSAIASITGNAEKRSNKAFDGVIVTITGASAKQVNKIIAGALSVISGNLDRIHHAAEIVRLGLATLYTMLVDVVGMSNFQPSSAVTSDLTYTSAVHGEACAWTATLSDLVFERAIAEDEPL